MRFLNGTILIVVACLFSAMQDSSPADVIVSRLNNYTAKLPQEKVYLHTDKPYYSPGDTIWLKGYLTHAMSHLPDSTSRTLYVDLIEPKLGRLVARKTLRATAGFANGEIALPDSLKEGRYHIRAYTNWMRNFPEELFYSKGIDVLRYAGRKSAEDARVTLSTITDLQFFPEGGNLVHGIESRVAFKATNVEGHGIDVKGFVLNSKKDTVSTFTSKHLGMGSLRFIPDASETYTAFIKNVSPAKSFPLQKASRRGYTLEVDNTSQKDQLKISFNSNVTELRKNILIVHQRGLVRFAAEIAGPTGTVTIPREKLPDDGIVHITLFNPDGRPVCERLAFIDNEEPLKAELISDKSELQGHSPASFELAVKDFYDDPVEGNFSVSVTNESHVLVDPYAENIKTYLLLSSEARDTKQTSIQGTIEQPGYYFQGDPEAPANLDLLLMTQGWRRFDWNDVLFKAPADPKYFVESGLRFTGNVRQKNGLNVAREVPLIFMLSGENGESQVVQGTSAPDGRFSSDYLEFYGRTTIGGSTQDKEKKIKLDFDSLFHQPVEVIPYRNIISDMENLILRSQSLSNQLKPYTPPPGNKLLKDVVVQGQKIETQDARRNIAPEVRKSNAVKIDLVQCANATTVLQLLQAKVPGTNVYLDPKDGRYHVLLRNANTFSLDTDPLYILDGIPVAFETITSLVPCDIESIEVFRGPVANYGSRATTGAIAFYTRTSNPANEKTGLGNDMPSKFGIAQLLRNGYDAPRQFYSPQYKPGSKPTGQDQRTTVYWQPNLITDHEGRAQFSFSTSDESQTDLRITLQGISLDGRPIFASFTRPVR